MTPGLTGEVRLTTQQKEWEEYTSKTNIKLPVCYVIAKQF
jgi:hypothetical protein